MPTSIKEFTVLPLALPPVPTYSHNATHYLYLRPHAPKIPTEDTPRQLFLANLSVTATPIHIRALFTEQLGGGRIEDVAFEESHAGANRGITAPVTSARGKKRKRGGDGEVQGREVGQLPHVWDRELHRSGGTAVVTFVDKASADLALREAKKAAKSGKGIVWGGANVDGRVPPLGSARYLAHHRLRYPDHSTLQTSVDEYMAAFTAREEAIAKERARLAAEPDSDGFITVTRGPKAPRQTDAESEAKKEEAERAARKREKKKVGQDFYRFQVREKRKEVQQDLVRGFEEDRRRLEEMRRRKGRVKPE